MELVGYLLEELRDAKNFANFQKDVASGAPANCAAVCSVRCSTAALCACVVPAVQHQHSRCRVAAPLPCALLLQRPNGWRTHKRG